MGDARTTNPIKYRTIVADPPWPYADGAFKSMSTTGRSQNVKRDGDKALRGVTVKRDLPYKPMTCRQIEGLDVERLADPAGCRLFLWTTNRFLHNAFHVLDWWGFRYVQMLTWHKPNPVPFPVDVAPGSAEFILTGLIGTPGKLAPWPASVVTQGASKHSQKPDVFLDLVEQSSPGPYLELFSRRSRFNWDTWGDEALGGLSLLDGGGR